MWLAISLAKTSCVPWYGTQPHMATESCNTSYRFVGPGCGPTPQSWGLSQVYGPLLLTTSKPEKEKWIPFHPGVIRPAAPL